MRSPYPHDQRKPIERLDFGVSPSSPKLAHPRKKRDSPAIQVPDHRPNPYRYLQRRRFSKLLLLLLIFVLGVWLWDNHSRPAPGYPPDAIELAIRKADRDLRLAEGTAQLPVWLQPVLGIDPLDETISTAISSLELLMRSRPRHSENERIRALNDEAAYALSILIALEAKSNPAAAPFQLHGLVAPPSGGQVLSRIIRGQESWWDLAYLRSLNYPGTRFAAQLVESRSSHLVRNAVKARCCVIALTLAGLLFLPGTLLAFMRIGKKEGPLNYSHHWPFAFGIGIFLLAALASIGFSIALQSAAPQTTILGSPPLIPLPLYTLLDAAILLLPALIAIALLFRRARHAISRLGLAGPLSGRMILACFAFLQIIDFGLRMALGLRDSDPLGGLSSMESGTWGLVYSIAIACLAAPVAGEILYRGILFRTLANRLRLPLAVVVSSLVFALVHFCPLSSLILLALLGACCALCYASSRSLLTAIALHALYSSAIKIPEWIVYHAPLS